MTVSRLTHAESNIYRTADSYPGFSNRRNACTRIAVVVHIRSLASGLCGVQGRSGNYRDVTVMPYIVATSRLRELASSTERSVLIQVQ